MTFGGFMALLFVIFTIIYAVAQSWIMFGVAVFGTVVWSIVAYIESHPT